jgi:hypothetical protein
MRGPEMGPLPRSALFAENSLKVVILPLTVPISQGGEVKSAPTDALSSDCPAAFEVIGAADLKVGVSMPRQAIVHAL